MSHTPTADQLERRKLWVAGLRSGKYEQCRGSLEVVKGGKVSHCCLGVACRVALENGVEMSVVEGNYRRSDGMGTSFDGQVGTLPTPVARWLGLSLGAVMIPYAKYKRLSLVQLNDVSESPFSEIATVIEEEFIKPFELPAT